MLHIEDPRGCYSVMKSWRMDARSTEERSLLRKQGKRQRKPKKISVDG